jgi:aspartate aminotransferase
VFTSLNIGASFLPYYDPITCGLGFTALKAAIHDLPPESVIVLQTGAQNPTGCDPSQEQWEQLASVFKEGGHLALFDAAYPGFASGNMEKDLHCLRLFVDLDIPVVLAATYGKCFGLYCERVGTLSIVATDQDIRERVEIQMRLLARSESGPMPDFGSSIVENILNDHDLELQWREEVREMAGELRNRRMELKKKLDALGTPGDWSCITNQKGMFTYVMITCLINRCADTCRFTGLSLPQIHHLRDKHHVYLQLSGRLSVAYEPPSF